MLEARWSRIAFLIVALSPLALCSCEREFESWAPPLQEASTRYLRDEAEQALTLLKGAREHLTSDPARADHDLAGAEEAVLRLAVYYLPLLEAREHAYNAHFLLHARQTKAVQEELDDTRRILEEVAEQGGPQLTREVEETLSIVGEARASLDNAPEEASRSLSSLVVKLSYMLLKADLILKEPLLREGSQDLDQTAPPTA
jgi:hypothetical protein